MPLLFRVILRRFTLPSPFIGALIFCNFQPQLHSISKMKISCELCKKKARIHCDCDKASLCWDCDADVHSANFLVARHFRRLLCYACQSPTVWTARGAVLGVAVSICSGCSTAGRFSQEKEIEENQVVPWLLPSENSSISDESVCDAGVRVYRERIRNSSSDDDRDCSSSHSQLPSYSAAEVTGERRRVRPKIKTTTQEQLRRIDHESGTLFSETGSGAEILTVDLNLKISPSSC